MKKILSVILAVCVIMCGFSFVAFAEEGEKTETKRPVIILKFDDMGASNIEGFQKIIDECKKLEVKCSVGIIVSRLDRGTPYSYYERVRSWYEEGVEIWNHGYYHAREEFSTNSAEQQAIDFGKAQKILKDYCGITVTAFGSPYNNSTLVTQQMLAENFPEIKAVMLATDKENKNPNAKYLSESAKLESATGVVSKFEDFKAEYKQKTDRDYLVLQGHPSAWTDEDYAEFEKIIALLKDDGCEFKTPTEYAEGSLAPLSEPLYKEMPIEVKLNKEYVDFDTAPELSNDRIMVPFRKIFELLNADVDYDADTQMATAKKDGIEIKITNNSNTAYINGSKAETDVAPMLKDNRFLVPLRFISESLGCFVYWNQDMKTASIITDVKKQTVPEGAWEIKDDYFNDYQFAADEFGFFSYDGDENTVWSCEGKGKWITYDLGEVKDVSKASVMWNKGNERIAYYKVYLSDDNQNFELVYDGQTSGTNAGYEDVSFGEGKKARYVKRECNGNSKSNWNAIKEIIIYK